MGNGSLISVPCTYRGTDSIFIDFSCPVSGKKVMDILFELAGPHTVKESKVYIRIRKLCTQITTVVAALCFFKF